MLNKNDANLL